MTIQAQDRIFFISSVGAVIIAGMLSASPFLLLLAAFLTW